MKLVNCIPTKETKLSKTANATATASTLSFGSTFDALVETRVNDHAVTDVHRQFTLPTETQGSGSVTGGTATFVKTVSLSGHTLSGTTQAADTTISDSATGIPTTKAIKNYVDSEIAASFAANDAMVFKGTVTVATDITSLTNYSAGWTYLATAAFTISSVGTVEVGDMIICRQDRDSYNAGDWVIIQTNINGALYKGSNTFTSGQVLVADGTTGQVRTSGYTIAKSVPANAVFTDTYSKPYEVGTSAPTNTESLWIDTNSSTGGLKYYNGSTWTHVPVAFMS